MKVDDIRVFVPSKDYQVSKEFYTALGFKGEYASDDLTLFTNGECAFFLQRYYDPVFAENLMMQLSVIDIQEALETIEKMSPFKVRFEPIKQEAWGKVIYLWGPSGELWHITEFKN